MSIFESIVLLVFGSIVVSAEVERNGYPRDNPSSRLIYDAVYPVEKLTNEEMSGGEIPGDAGKDYPILRDVPETRFDCGQQQYPGYYADVEAGCQAFHICQISGRKDSFLCPNGTIFNQETLVCDWWYNFDCSNAQSFYSINEAVVRAMEEADRLSAEKNAGQQGYRYNTPINGVGGSRLKQHKEKSSINDPPQSDFDTVVVEAARTSSRSRLPLQAQRTAYSKPEVSGSLTKSSIEDLDSGFNEAPKITGVRFAPRDEGSPARGYLPAEF